MEPGSYERQYQADVEMRDAMSGDAVCYQCKEEDMPGDMKIVGSAFLDLQVLGKVWWITWRRKKIF